MAGTENQSPAIAQPCCAHSYSTFHSSWAAMGENSLFSIEKRDTVGRLKTKMVGPLSSRPSDSMLLLQSMSYADPPHKTRLSWSPMVLWGSSLGILDLRMICLSLPLRHIIKLFLPTLCQDARTLGHGMAFFIPAGTTHTLVSRSAIILNASPTP